MELRTEKTINDKPEASRDPAMVETRDAPTPEFVKWVRENSIPILGVLLIALGICVVLHFQPLERNKAKDIADTVNHIIQALAIVIGGLWAIFRYRKGREFQESLVPNVSGRIATIEGRTFIIITTRVQNVGQTKIEFLTATVEINEYLKPEGAEVITVPDRFIIAFNPLHADDLYIEPNEIINGTRFVAIPNPPDLGFRLDFKVVSVNNNYTWRTNCMIEKSDSNGNMQQEEVLPGG